MRYAPLLITVAFFAGCASSPARYSLDVKATRVQDQEIKVEGRILDHGNETETELVLPKVLMAPEQVATIYVGDGPAGVANPDGVHGTVTTVEDQVLFTACIIEDGRETWRAQTRAPISTETSTPDAD